MGHVAQKIRMHVNKTIVQIIFAKLNLSFCMQGRELQSIMVEGW